MKILKLAMFMLLLLLAGCTAKPLQPLEDVNQPEMENQLDIEPLLDFSLPMTYLIEYLGSEDTVIISQSTAFKITDALSNTVIVSGPISIRMFEGMAFMHTVELN